MGLGLTMADEAPPRAPDQTEERAGAPLPLQLELPVAKPESAEVGSIPPARPRTGTGVRPLLVASAIVSAVVLIAAVCDALVQWILPWYIRRDCIEAAAARGIELAIDEARLGRDGFRLIGVRAALPAVGALHAEAAEIDVETSHLHTKGLAVRGAELTLTGSIASIESALGKWQASQTANTEAAWDPSSISIDGARIRWQSPVGENVRVDAADVRMDVGLKKNGADVELHARSDRVKLATPGGLLGPWRIDVDRIPGSSRTRIALDPGVPESCTILLVGDGARVSSIDVVVPRSPVAHLGLPAQWLDAGGSALQIETTFHYVTLGPNRADASVRGGIYGVQVGGLPRPVDVAWEASFSGNATSGIDVKKARLAFGPLVGPLSGTLKPFDDGFRLDLAWAAGPLPCAAFEVALGVGQPFDVGYLLRTLKKSPEVAATLQFSFDSRDVSATRIDFAPEIACARPLP